MLRRCPMLAVLLGVALSAVVELRAESVYQSTTGVALDVQEDGKYSVSCDAPPFVFRGSLGKPAAGLATGTGTDAIGAYQEISFRFGDASGRTAAIRAYADRPVVLFTVTWPAKSANTEGFPRLVATPDVPYKSSFQGKWGAYKFDDKGTEGPWANFDANGNTYILSAASNFLVSYLTRNSAGEIESRIHPAIKTLPAGFTHGTLLVIASGINRSFDIWGRA